MENFSQLYNIILDIFFKSKFCEPFGKTKLGLAKFLGLSQGKTQYWEKGSWPSARDLAIIHKKLGINLYWLVTGEGEPFEVTPAAAPAEANEVEALKRRIAELDAEKEQVASLKNELLAAQREIIALQKALLKQGTKTVHNDGKGETQSVLCTPAIQAGAPSAR